jgi:hypothetical protein
MALTGSYVKGKSIMSGNSSLNIVMFAPNGCTIEKNMTLIPKVTSPSMSLFFGLNMQISGSLDLISKLNVQPLNGKEVGFGISYEITKITASFYNTDTYTDIAWREIPGEKLPESGVDVTLSIGFIPTFGPSLTVLDSATINTEVSTEVFAELSALIAPPESVFAPLTASKYNQNSLFSTGDCMQEFFMAYDINVGLRAGTLTVSLDFAWWEETKTYDSLWSFKKSIISGCIATSYYADFSFIIKREMLSAFLNDPTIKANVFKIITRVLDIKDIQPDRIAIKESSDTTGRVILSLPIPPALAQTYPEAPLLETILQDRAKSSTFNSLIDSATGVQVNADCPIGQWGAACDQVCQIPPKCADVLCDPLTGVV